MLASSKGIKLHSLMKKKATGETNAVSDPTATDTPNRISVIPKYMGFRVNRKTPDVKRVVGFRWGLTVLLCFFIRASAHKFTTTPIRMGAIPAYLWRSEES